MTKPNKRRARRSFTAEFKADAVSLVRSGRSVASVADGLGLIRTTLSAWVRRADVDAGKGDPSVLTTEERREMAQLRKENKQLRMEREILKAAATFFAKENA